MPKYRVIGADQKTAKDVTFTVDAADESEVEVICRHRGVLLEKAFRVKRDGWLVARWISYAMFFLGIVIIIVVSENGGPTDATANVVGFWLGLSAIVFLCSWGGSIFEGLLKSIRK